MHLPAKANSLSVQTFMANKSLSDSDYLWKLLSLNVCVYVCACVCVHEFLCASLDIMKLTFGLCLIQTLTKAEPVLDLVLS